MKKTIFEYTIGETKKTHEVEFIYEPNGADHVLIKDNLLRVKKVVDEFTDNAQVQIRHVLLQEIDSLDKQII